MFVFDGGTFDEQGTAGIRLPPDELRSWARCTEEQAAGWTAGTYAEAAAAPPGTNQRDTLVSALTSTFFTGQRARAAWRR